MFTSSLLHFRPVKIILTVFLCLLSTNLIAEQTFDAWLLDLQGEAVKNGISKEVAGKVFQRIRLMPDVIELDRSQPEFITPFLDYYNRRIDTKKVIIGREKLKEHAALLNALENDYGVPKAYLIAFWGMETHYGANQGKANILSSLATLAYEGRRADFFKQQLMDAMRIIEQNKTYLENFNGSWAGAFGHMQFMPSTFLTYAVDGDADQQIDLIHSEADALTSAANYLSQVGWQVAQPVMMEVQIPERFPIQEAHLNNKKTLAEWMALGVVAITGKEYLYAQKKRHQHKRKNKNTKYHRNKFVNNLEENPPVETYLTRPLNKMIEDTSLQASILLPQGWRGPAFMVFDNFSAIMDWNRSVNYALCVTALAKQINEEQPLLAGRNSELGALSFIEMHQLQGMLNSLGFDAGEPDGLPGLKTQAAIRAYQLAQHLPADGYASPSLYQRLQQELTLTLQ